MSEGLKLYQRESLRLHLWVSKKMENVFENWTLGCIHQDPDKHCCIFLVNAMFVIEWRQGLHALHVDFFIFS